MEFEALDGIKLVMLMAAGLLFAVVGLYLLIRPKPEGSAAKIELFGMKFESSSAGLLVFLIGAVFLVIPLFVAEKKPVVVAGGEVAIPAPAPAPGEMPNPKPSGTSELGDEPKAVQPTPTPVVTAGEKAEEAEPNGTFDTAMPFALGQTIKGQAVSGSDIDWFVLPIPDSGIKGHEVKLKHYGKTGGWVTAVLFNKREEKVGSLAAGNGATYLPIKTDLKEKLYFRVYSTFSYEREYELTVLPGSSN